MKILSLFLILITFGFHLAYAESESQIEQESSSPVTYDFGKLVIGDANVDEFPYDTLYVSGGGEVSINENVFLKIYYNRLSINETYIVASTSDVTVDLGYHYPLNDITDIVIGGGIVYGRRDIDINGTKILTDSDIGIGLNVGVRAVPIPEVELGVSARYINIFDDNTTTFNAYITNFINGGNFGIGLVFEKSSNYDMVGVSFTFKSK